MRFEWDLLSIHKMNRVDGDSNVRWMEPIHVQFANLI